jgi:hypothetical protein
MIYRRLGFFAAARDKGNVSSVWALVVRQVNFGRATMPHRQQFRTYAEYCLRLAELIDSPDQKASLNATANAWHRFAQELDLRTEPSAMPSVPTALSR